MSGKVLQCTSNSLFVSCMISDFGSEVWSGVAALHAIISGLEGIRYVIIKFGHLGLA